MGNLCNCYVSKYKQFLNLCIKNDELQAVLFYSKYYNEFDIRENSDYLFKVVCVHNYIDLAHWLCSLEDNYRIKINNGRIVKYWIKDEILKYLTIHNTNEDPINSECYICLESKKMYQFKCKHGLCMDCLAEILGTKLFTDCGICRKKFNLIYSKI
jgi:hypothetical protein